MPNPKTVVRTDSTPGSIKLVQLTAVSFQELWDNYPSGNPYDNPSGGHIDLWNGGKLTGFGTGVRVSWNIVIPGIWSDFRDSKTILFFPIE
jgi:hypothetical protein